LELYIRCDRGAGLETRPLKNEYTVLNLLQTHGIPVPHIYGWCEDPEAIVMAAMPDTPFLGGADTNPALHALVMEYVSIMTRVHQIPVAEAVRAGLALPETPEDIAFGWFNEANKAYQATKSGPDPFVEFVSKYLRRTYPRHRTQTALLIADAPQFFHDGQRVTAIYDLELAYIGDPMADLASLRVRDINEPIGGMTALIRHYAMESGMEIDWPALDFHTIVGYLSSPMMAGPTLRNPHPHPAFVEYLSWDWGCARAVLEVMADTNRIKLDPTAPLSPVHTRNDHALEDLVAFCKELPVPDGQMREARALSLANYARRADQFGAELDRLELTDAEALLQTSFTSLGDAEAALENFVLESGPEHDAELVRFFHRRVMRRLQLIQDYPGPIVKRGPTPVDRSANKPRH
jgi:hypothetical protein